MYSAATFAWASRGRIWVSFYWSGNGPEQKDTVGKRLSVSCVAVATSIFQGRPPISDDFWIGGRLISTSYQRRNVWSHGWPAPYTLRCINQEVQGSWMKSRYIWNTVFTVGHIRCQRSKEAYEDIWSNKSPKIGYLISVFRRFSF
jgi:hypothetical protein